MILIISKTKKLSAPFSEMLHFMGIPSYATTPTEALSKISPIFSCVLIINPDTLADKADYTARIRAYYHLPIFAIKNEVDVYDNLIFDGIFESKAYAPKIISFICKYAEEKDFKIPGTYRLAGIDASINLRSPIYFDRVIPLTKTEAMILRVLTCAYPVPLNAKTILKYAFRETRRPEEANVRTHISIMNRKFREITGRNLTILSPSEGYRILTPELIEATVN